MIEQRIIDYLEKESNIKLTLTTASAIVKMVLGSNRMITAAAQLFKDSEIAGLVLLRTIETTDEFIEKQIAIAIDQKPVKGFYVYKCFNSNQEFEGHIYSADPNLFD